MPHPIRIANKIVLLVLCLELFSIALWGSLTYSASRRELLQTINSHLEEVATRTTEEIGDFFLPIHAQLQYAALALGNTPLNHQEQQILISSLFQARPEITEVSLMDAGRRQILFSLSRYRSQHGEAVQADISDVLDEALNRPLLVTPSRIYFSEYSEPLIALLRPFVPQHARNSDPLILVTEVNLKWLWDKVQALRIDSGGYAYVVGVEGNLIAHPDPSQVLRRDNLHGSELHGNLFRASKPHELNIYQSLTGERVAGLSRFDPEHNWWVVVEQPVDQGLAPLNRIIRWFVFAFLLAAMVTILIVTIFSRITMRPLEILREHLERQASGEQGVRMPVPRNTELATLANAFNTMTENLDQRFRELRQSREELHESHEQFRLLLDSTAEAIYGVDLQGRCTFCNPAGLRMLGYESTDQLIGKDMHALIHHSDSHHNPRSAEEDPIHRPLLAKGELHLAETLLWRADNSSFHAECWAHPMTLDGAVTGAVITFIDITDRKKHTEQLAHAARHDDLTGLANRHQLLERIDAELANSTNHIHGPALLLLDLDHFKEVNDSLGHATGDLLLQGLGPRLRQTLNAQDVLARLGGDEFAVLLKSPCTPKHANDIAATLHEAICQPFDLDGLQVQLDVSIGIAMAPQHGKNADLLLRHADVAMFHAKQNYHNFTIYDESFDPYNRRRLALITDLRGAIKRGELYLLYQPKVRLCDRALVGFEALARWEHPEYGTIPPDEFINLAEVSGVINPLTEWVIRQAAEDCARLQTALNTPVMAINISARNLQDERLAQKIATILELHKLRDNQILLEITESAIMVDPEQAKQTIGALSKLGIRTAIDDFGTGYSSLAYLKELPIDELKIDKSFVLDMETDENDKVIVHSTIDLAHHLGKAVTGEGVENQAAWDLLESLGCDTVQGYFIAPPLAFDQIAYWYSKWMPGAEIKQTNINR